MRHRKALRKLGRVSAHRARLFQHLAEGLFRSYQIITTVEKAKEARSYVERLITLAKKGEDPQAQRRVLMELEDKTAYMTLFQKIGPLYQKEDRKGGYTRIVRLGHRPGDGAEMAVLELVDREKLGAAPGKPPKTKKEAKEKAGAAGR